jgi:opacity protein-like surface antigen
MLQPILLMVMMLLTAALPAEASRRNFGSSWYVGLGAYAAMQEDSTISGATSTQGGDEGDWVLNSASLYLGWRPGFLFSTFGAFRFELEGNLRVFSLGGNNGGGFDIVDYDNGLRVASAMANAYFDLHLDRHITPYIGIGYGYALGKVQGEVLQDIIDSGQDDRVPAYQFMAGIAFTPEGLPRTEWSFGYNRFVITDGLEFDGANGLITVDDLQTDSLHAGIRYFF